MSVVNIAHISAGLPVAKDSGQSPSAGVNTAFVSAGLPAKPITVVPLTITGESLNLESPYAVDDPVDTAAAAGGQTPYSYAITAQAADVGVLKVTGTLDPDATGVYVENGTYNGEPAYERTDGSYWIWHLSSGTHVLSTAKDETDISWIQLFDGPAGEYQSNIGTTGTATVANATPFQINSATGAITIADADPLIVGHVWTVNVEVTDDASATADDDWVVTLVGGVVGFKPAWAEGINQYIGMGV